MPPSATTGDTPKTGPTTPGTGATSLRTGATTPRTKGNPADRRDAVDGANARDVRDAAVGGRNDAMDFGDDATDVSDAPDPSTVSAPLSTSTFKKRVRFHAIPLSEFLKNKNKKKKSPNTER